MSNFPLAWLSSLLFHQGLCLTSPRLSFYTVIGLSFSSEWSLLPWLFYPRNPPHHPPLPTRRLSPQLLKRARERPEVRDRLVAFVIFFDVLLSLASLIDHPPFFFPFYAFWKCKVTRVLPLPNRTNLSSVPDVSVTCI